MESDTKTGYQNYKTDKTKKHSINFLRNIAKGNPKIYYNKSNSTVY